MNQLERNKKSEELTDTFVSLYDPNLSPLSCLRTTRGLMNTFITLFQDITDTLESHLELIHPKQTATYDAYRDHFNFLKAFYKTLQKTNIKLAFTPSKVPPKEYDNTFVWYYSDEDIEKEDPMIVENADDYIYTPTLESKDKNPLPSTAEQTTRKPDDKFLRSNAIIEVHTKCEGEIVSSLPILIGSWCELNNLNKAAMPHIVSKLFHSMYETLESLDFRKED